MSREMIDHAAEKRKEKAVLVGVATRRTRPDEIAHHLDELARLAETADAEIVGRVVQRTPTYNPRTLIGPGKIEEILETAHREEANLIIFDEGLTGSQIRILEQELPEMKIVDRPMLILDIFALHAKTAEARLMVEIAQLEYMMPRLTRMWTHLSRQEGGHSIATRGPGETQLETDRRIVRRRLTELKKRLDKIESARNAQADQRNSVFQVAVAGYTNAGKSTLVNRLTDAGVQVADKLFATLDSTTRKLWLSPKHEVILSDTVGFIRKLPHHLVASFRSTLGVVERGDVVLHVADASDPALAEQIEVTETVLEGLIDDNTPRLLLLNKWELLDDDAKEHLLSFYPEAFPISAFTGEGIEPLLERLITLSERWKEERQAELEEPVPDIWDREEEQRSSL